MHKIVPCILVTCINSLLLLIPCIFVRSSFNVLMDFRFISIISLTFFWIACDFCVPNKNIEYHRSVKVHLAKYDYFGYLTGALIYFHILICLNDTLYPIIDELRSEFAWMGIGIAITGLIIRLWSILILRNFFTEQLKVLISQPLVKNGIFGLIRHPSYLGILLIQLGIALITSSFWGIIYYFLIILPLILVIIKKEEEVMGYGFGLAYDQYCQRTKKLIPLFF